MSSLPRPPELRELLVRKDQSQPYDKVALGRLTGIDIVNGGMMSKPGYAIYVADRPSVSPATNRQGRGSARATTRIFLPLTSGKHRNLRRPGARTLARYEAVL